MLDNTSPLRWGVVSIMSSSLLMIAVSSKENRTLGFGTCWGGASNSIVAPLAVVEISVSEVMFCQLAMECATQPARKWSYLSLRYSLRSWTNKDKFLTDCLISSNDLIISCRLGSFCAGNLSFYDLSLKKANYKCCYRSLCVSSYRSRNDDNGVSVLARRVYALSLSSD